METKLIRLKDGTLVEVSTDQSQKISSKYADKVEESVDAIKPILFKVCRPIIDAYREISQDMRIEQAEVELGLSFEGEGNLYVTKAKAGANLIVRLVLKP